MDKYYYYLLYFYVENRGSKLKELTQYPEGNE